MSKSQSSSVARALREALALHESGRLDRAECGYLAVLELAPRSPAALLYLGLLECQTGNASGLTRMEEALEIREDKPEYWTNYGVALRDLGKGAEAESAFRKALELAPAAVEARIALGEILQRRGLLDEAIGHYEDAAAQAPERVDCLVNLGGALNDASRFDDAARALERAVERAPEVAEAHLNLGRARANQNRTGEAIAGFRHAAALRPGYTLAEWSAALCLPVIYRSEDEIDEWRERWAQNLESLAAGIALSTPEAIASAFRCVTAATNFYLHYQGRNDRILQERYGALVQRIVSARYPRFVEPPARRHRGRPRVGFASHHLHHHSVAKTHGGWITRLARDRFEVFALYTGAQMDATSRPLAESCEHFIHRPLVDEAFIEFVRSLDLDVLVFPDLGMEPAYQVLAALRLGRLQCNGLGHPVTSGLETIDVALSSALMEPPGAESHYTERLVRLPNTGFCYPVPSVAAPRQPFVRGSASVVYVCAQNLIKLLPREDDLFARLAREVPGSVFWFVSHRSRTVTNAFEHRLSAAFARAGVDPAERIRMLPRMDQQTFYAMYHAADVFLDGHRWSGNNTTLEALQCGLPVVTWPGEMMRARHSCAILQHIGMPETIAEDADSFVAIAARLGADPAEREAVKAVTAERRARAFGDMAPVAALEDFLESVAS